MKKILFAVLMLTALIVTSCDNDDIEIVYEQSNQVTISLTDFCSQYNLANYARFNSEYGKFIVVRVLFYNSNGQLVDSIRNYSTNLNQVKKDIRLASGKYTAVATLTFADKDYTEWWTLTDKDDLNKVYLDNPAPQRFWNIMSCTSQEFTIESGKTTELQLTPKPVGTYYWINYYNFQYASKTDMNQSKVKDNGIRWIGFLTKDLATGYKLNPKSSDRYIYRATDSGGSYWILDGNEPSDWGWTTYFRDDLYGLGYILAPKCRLCFGYQMDGDDGFVPVGEADYTITSGKNYYGEWDWINNPGTPFFGMRSESARIQSMPNNTKNFMVEKATDNYPVINQYRQK